MNNYLDALTRKYYQNLVNRRGSGGTSRSPLSYSLKGFQTQFPETDPNSFQGRVEGAIGPESTLGRFIDVISRPGYAVGNALKESAIDPVIDIAQGTRESTVAKAIDSGANPINTFFNATTGAALSGLSGRSKPMPSDASLSRWEPTSTGEQVAKFALGFALDVGLDPTTYIPGGAIAAVLKKTPGIAHATGALRTAGTLEKVGQELPAEVKPLVNVATSAPKTTEEFTSALNRLSVSSRTLSNASRDANPAAVLQHLIPKTVEPHVASTIKAAAEIPRTATGQRVYDIDRLPTLWTTPEPVVAPKALSTPKVISEATHENPVASWVELHSNAPISVVDKGIAFAGDTAESGGLTLGEFYRNAIERANTSQLAYIGRLFNETEGIAATGTARTAPNAIEAASVAVSRAQTVPRAIRIAKAERQKVLASLKDMLDPADYTYLIHAGSGASYNKRVQEILARTAAVVEPPVSIVDDAGEAARKVIEGAPGPRKPLNASSPAVQGAISSSVTKQLMPDLPYRTTVKDVARTEQQIHLGKGVADRGINKRAQYNIFRVLTKRASSSLMQSGMSGQARADAMRKIVMPWLKEADDVLRSRGLEPILGEGHSGFALSLYDILVAVDKPKGNRALILDSIFDLQKKNMAPTALSDAVEELLMSMKRAGITSEREIDDWLRTVVAGKTEAGSLFDDLGHILLGEVRGSHAPVVEGGVRKALTKRTTARKWSTVEGKKVSKWVRTEENLGGEFGSKVANEWRNALLNPVVIRALASANIRNSARYGAQLGYEVQRLSEEVVSEFFDTWMKNTTSTGEAIAAYNATGKAVDAAGDVIQAMPASKAAAKDAVQIMTDDLLANDLPAMQGIEKIVGAADEATLVKAGQNLYDNYTKEVIEDLPTTQLVDVGAVTEKAVEHSVVRAIFPFTTRNPRALVGRAATGTDHVLQRVIAQTGHATLRPAITHTGTVVRNLANGWRSVLTDIHRVFPDPDVLAPMMVRLQQGERITGNFTKAQQRAVDDFTSLTKILFETNTDKGIRSATGVFFRNASEIEHVNNKLTQMGLPDSMRFDTASALIESSRSGRPLREVLADQWRSWKIDDPVDFLARMQAVATSVVGDQAIVREASRLARSKGLMSMSQRKGFVQITDTTEKSVMARYLPKGAWYHPDIVEEIKGVDNILQQSLMFDSPFGKWVNTYLDPFLNMWKAGMTIYRPGHHVRNLVGDSSLAFLADGLGRVHHARNALKVMAIRDNYDGWSALKALQGAGVDLSEATLRRGDDVVAHITLKGGRKVTLDANTVNEYVRSHGVLMDFVSGEDLLRSVDDYSSSIKAIQDSLSIFGGRVKGAAGWISEHREDYVRLSHYLQILEQHGSKYGSVDELMEFAARRVRKWHPDGTDLTPFETKVARRVIPFYSWNKKTIPLVVESMLLHPGRINMWPKATYNAAKAAGIDLQSISDPFPADQLFPSFLTDDMTGPVMENDNHYYGVSPGIASTDIMNQFIGDPSGSFAGMLSPFIKVPMELMTGTRADTQSSLPETSEYLGSNIPGVAQAQSISGYDILGSLLGKEVQPIAAVQKGNRPIFDKAALMNYLTGLGISDMSKPSYINYAEIQRRNAAGGR